MLKNKCTKLVVAIGITLFAGTAQAALIDLAVNGDFETGDFYGLDTVSRCRFSVYHY